MRMFVFICICAVATINSFAQKVDVQGHRGARGIMPENSIAGFLTALNYGVTTIEMDLVITADNKVIVSHEPYFSSEICTDSTGSRISPEDQKIHNIYKMNYEEVKKFDCGSIAHPHFKEQEKRAVSKPLLKNVIKAVEWYIKSYTFYEVDYNLEIKSSPAGDGKFHPSPEEFSDLVYDLVDQYLPWDRVIIQSFDFRVLNYWHKKFPGVRLAALIETQGPVSTKIAALGFEPDIYSPNYQLINQERVDYLHKLDIKVVPWTVNNPDDMLRMIKMGVDGFITDYPDRAAELDLTLNVNINSNEFEFPHIWNR